MSDPTDDEVVHDLSLLEAVSERNLAQVRAETLRQMVRVILASGGAMGMVLAGAALLAASVRVQVAEVERVIQAPPAQVVEPRVVTVPAPSAPVEAHPFDAVAGKTYAGRILSVTEDNVCFTGPEWCTYPVSADPSGKAVLDKDGAPVRDPGIVYAVTAMKTWVGHEAWLAPSPADPQHVAKFWARDGDELVSFMLERRDRAKEMNL